MDENRLLEKDIQATEQEIVSLREQITRIDEDRRDAGADYDKSKQRFSELTKLIQSLENQIYSLERDIKHVRALNDNFKKEIDSTDKNIQVQLRKNNDISKEIDKLEADLRNKRGSFDELLTELERLQISYDEVEDDNDQLQADIERFKEMVRNLSAQNQELVDELDKISEQDEAARSILNRRNRIESLIAKAETTVSRNQINSKH